VWWTRGPGTGPVPGNGPGTVIWGWRLVPIAAAAALSGLLLFQALTHGADDHFTGPALGSRDVAQAQVLVANGSPARLHSLSPEGACALVVVASTYCGICQRMRYTWHSAFRAIADSLDVKMTAIWLFPQDSESVAQFTGKGIWDGIHVVRFAEPDDVYRLGVIGTPLTYLLDSHGLLRLGVFGDQLPPRDSLVAHCAD